MKTALIISLFLCLAYSNNFKWQLDKAGENKKEIERAIKEVPEEQRPAMKWLISHMQEDDLQSLSSQYLITNSKYAFKAKKQFSWTSSIPEKIFLDNVLPYASLNERRDTWRKEFFNKFSPLVKNAKSGYEAAAILNNNIFEIVGVKYSTKRPKADQSPYESIESGLASCTGLSFLLIDACRSVGIPARFVGTPMWYNDSGNHSWVEIWDGGWHFTGAAEPTGERLNEVWFSELAGNAKKGDMKYGIFAATWTDSRLYFPMDWMPSSKQYSAIDVTDTYINHHKKHHELVAVRIRAINHTGSRESVNVIVTGDDYYFQGQSKDETCDMNDYLVVMLPKGKTFTIRSKNDSQVIAIENECIVSLSAK